VTARFGLIVMADWSAAVTRGPVRPKGDRCWIGWCTPAAPEPETRYCRTRHEAEALIGDLVAACPGDVLVGFDFPFGCPAGSGLGGGPALARRLAGLIEDGPDGANNRFAVAALLNGELNGGEPGPFWGCPPAAACATLTSKRSHRRGGPFPDYRAADARLAARGIQPVWKLYTRGSVGGQMLVGLPALARLSDHPAFGACCRVWPFETGWDRRLDGVVLAEIWPSLCAHAAERHPIKDQRQVAAACGGAAGLDAAGRLDAGFARPPGLDDATAVACLAEEGWILGLGTGLV